MKQKTSFNAKLLTAFQSKNVLDIDPFDQRSSLLPVLTEFRNWPSTTNKQTRLVFDSGNFRNLDFELWTLDFFYGLRKTKSYKLDHSTQSVIDLHSTNRPYSRVGEVIMNGGEIIVTAQRPNSFFSFFRFGLGLVLDLNSGLSCHPKQFSSTDVVYKQLSDHLH